MAEQGQKGYRRKLKSNKNSAAETFLRESPLFCLSDGNTYIMKKYRYYYFDERNDDFANTGIKRKDLPEGYRYLPDAPLYKVAKPTVYYGVMPVASWLLYRVLRVRLLNRGVLDTGREARKGFFIYGNHTSYLTDALTSPIAAFPRQCYTVVSPEALSVCGIRTLVRLLGALPTPSGLKGYVEFNRAIEELYLAGNAITVYPEEHIRPKYNGIRDFPSAVLRRCHLPCRIPSDKAGIPTMPAEAVATVKVPA